MKAAVLGDSGVELREIDPPSPGPGQVLVRNRACGLNRADLLVAADVFHGVAGGAGTVLGLEWAGEVVELGEGVEGLAPGDRVMCSGGGGYAEYAVTDYGRAIRIPDGNMSWVEAASLPIALATMHDAVATNGRLQAGESALIQGASSGVGLMGLKIAKRMGASLVIGTSTNAERRGRLAEFGCDLALDSRDPGWADRVLETTDGKGVNLIVDQISAAVANDNMKAAAVLGRIVNVGRLGGGTGEFNFDLHALKRIDYIGVTFRTRSVEEVREIGRRMWADLGEAVTAGEMALPIDRTFPLSEAPAALAHMKANAHFGKIILET